jgi:hypothetical protein
MSPYTDMCTMTMQKTSDGMHGSCIIPVNFATKGRYLLEQLRKQLDMGKVAIHPDQHNECVVLNILVCISVLHALVFVRTIDD